MPVGGLKYLYFSARFSYRDFEQPDRLEDGVIGLRSLVLLAIMTVTVRYDDAWLTNPSRQLRITR